MLRKLILKSDIEAVIFPVTPPEYQIVSGMDTSSVNIESLGEVARPTVPTLQSMVLYLEFPATARHYECVGHQDPATIVAKLDAWMRAGTALRFLVSGTAVNVPVFLRAIDYGETDGTNDLHCRLDLLERRDVPEPSVEMFSVQTAVPRAAGTTQTQETLYTVKAGDTLWDICRQFYGDGTLCYKLATYNGIKNANLIYVGDVLKIPPAEALGAVTAVQPVDGGGGNVSAPKPPATYYDITINFAGLPADFGSVRYTFTNGQTGGQSGGVVKSSVPCRVAAGTKLSCQILPKVGKVARSVTVDGVSISFREGYFYVTADAAKNVAVWWASGG